MNRKILSFVISIVLVISLIWLVIVMGGRVWKAAELNDEAQRELEQAKADIIEAEKVCRNTPGCMSYSGP